MQDSSLYSYHQQQLSGNNLRQSMQDSSLYSYHQKQLSAVEEEEEAEEKGRMKKLVREALIDKVMMIDPVIASLGVHL